MRKKMRMIIVLVMCVLTLTNCENRNTDKIGERVPVEFSKHVDGDTSWFKTDGKEVKVRYIGIDTAETVKLNTPVESFGEEASAYTKSRLESADKIELEYDAATSEKDKYGRRLAWIWIDDSLLQEELVRKGYAEVAFIRDDYKYVEELEKAEREAQREGAAIWGEGD